MSQPTQTGERGGFADRHYRVLFLLVLVFAFLTRAWPAIAQYQGTVLFHFADYNHIVENIKTYLTSGEFSAQFSALVYEFLPQQLMAWLLHLVQRVAEMTGAQLPVTDETVGLSFRLFAVTAGTATVAATMVLARRMGEGRGTAIFAGLLLASAMLHALVSQEIRNDVFSGLFALLAVIFAREYLRAGKRHLLLLGGLMLGLGMASRSGVVVAVFPLLVAGLLNRNVSWRNRLSALALSGVAAVAAFVAFNWHIIVNLKTYIADHPMFQQGGMADSVPFQSSSGTGQWSLFWQLDYLSTSGLGLILFALAAAGLVIFLLDTSRSVREKALLAAFPLAYFLTMAVTPIWADRYGVPLLPFAAILAAMALDRALRAMRSQRWRVAVLALIVAGVAGKLILWDLTFATPSTRDQAAAWLEKNVPAGSGLVWTQMGNWKGQAWDSLFKRYAIANEANEMSFGELRELGYRYAVTGENGFATWYPQIEARNTHNKNMDGFQRYFADFYAGMIRNSRPLKVFSNPIYESGVFGLRGMGTGAYIFQLFQPEIVVREIAQPSGKGVNFEGERLFRLSWFSAQRGDRVLDSPSGGTSLRLAEIPNGGAPFSYYNGPYVPVLAGDYCATFRLRAIPHANNAFVRVGAALANNEWVQSVNLDYPALLTRGGKPFEIKVPFTWQDRQDMRLQTMLNGGSVRVDILRINLARVGRAQCQAGGVGR